MVGFLVLVGCCVAIGTSSAAGACNYWIDVVSLQVAILLHFCHNRGFVAFGWWVGRLAWPASHCQTCHGQKGSGVFPT